jgi:hypothetical protein
MPARRRAQEVRRAQRRAAPAVDYWASPDEVWDARDREIARHDDDCYFFCLHPPAASEVSSEVFALRGPMRYFAIMPADCGVFQAKEQEIFGATAEDLVSAGQRACGVGMRYLSSIVAVAEDRSTQTVYREGQGWLNPNLPEKEKTRS